MDAFICDASRTPIGRYGGAVAKMHPDDLAALVIKGWIDRNPELKPKAIGIPEKSTNKVNTATIKAIINGSITYYPFHQ